LVVSRNRNVVAEVEVLDLTSGASRGKVDLPGLGAVSITTRDTASPDLWVSYTDFVTPLKVLHTQIAGGDIGPLTTWADPPGAVVAVGAATRQEWVTSPDGTQVPMFIIAKGDPTEPRPTVLYGYGGFNVSLAPAYAATAAAWVEAGGVWAEANLRGGSEFGEEWHRDGMRANKQHVFDDFIASAQWLIDHGWTTPDQLGIYGGSNGGLLVGATMTQAPTLFRAVVCSAPLLDMVRYEKFGLGVTWNDEYGTADDPEELGWLLGYSPYHRVADGTRYPATLFTVFDSDTRVDPLHARKMCAALQASTTAPLDDAPVLFRREAKVGHATRSIGRSIELAGDILGFLADQLGLGGGT
jgi:prolyl oligopeptidase